MSIDKIKIQPADEKWTKTRYKNLLEQIDLCRPQIIFEFGVWKGFSAIRMMKQAMQHRQDCFYIGIDMFENITVEEAKWENHTKDLAIKKKVIALLKQELGPNRFCVVGGATKQVFRGVRRKILKGLLFRHYADFIFIDGGHSVETITHDWFAAESIMNEKTVVIFDDYYRDITDIGAFTTVEYIISQKCFNIEYLQPIDHFKTSDGRPQPTQMVKVTRVTDNQQGGLAQSHGLDENKLHNPYLQESSWDDDED